MKFALSFERVYPHAPEKVWHALVDPKALGVWLMETDFTPDAGRKFKMWCDDGAGGTDTYLCKLLAFEPPKRMLWSWTLEDRMSEEATLVEFHVEAVSGSLRLSSGPQRALSPAASRSSS